MLIKLEKEVKENLEFVSSYYGDAYWIDKQIPNIIAFEKFKIKNELDEMFRTDVIDEKKYISILGKPSEELIEKREKFLLNKIKVSKRIVDKNHLQKFSEINKIGLKRSHYDKYMKGVMRKMDRK